MAISLSEFIMESVPQLMCESIRQRDIEKAIKLISSYLNKRKIYTTKYIREFSIDGQARLGVTVWNEKDQGACFVWAMGDTAHIEQVLFTSQSNLMDIVWMSGEPTQFKWDVQVLAKGANLVQVCKLVEGVLSGRVAMTTQAINAELKDAQLFENLKEEDATKAEEILEVSKDPVIADLERRRSNMYMKLKEWSKKGKDTSGLQAEYDALKAELDAARLQVKANVMSTMNADKEINNLQAQFEEEERATPEERFDDMKSYIYNVIAGIKPLALLCGAPGVGKTFRVMQAVKGTGKRHGIDYKILKGKCTPTALYMALFEMRDEGKLLIFDDCDSIFKDSDAINLLKAAYDSGDERYVTWAVARPPQVSAEEGEMWGIAPNDKGQYLLPREFEYNGGGIIISNWRAGMIDTAVRSRALICDLDFTTDEILGLIEGLAPKIKPGIISDQAKYRALEYLKEMAEKKMPMELSIRNFTLCASLFDTDAPEKTIMRRINEQMRLASERGGKSY